MSKTYKVWIEIEEYNEETDESQTLDAPGSFLREFESYEEAYDYAQQITDMAEGLPE